MPDVNLDLAKPFFLVKILDKDSNDLKYVWSPNIFLDEERPDDNSKIAPETYIEDIDIKSNFEPPINLGEVKIDHSVGSAPNIAINDILQIYFGYYTLGNNHTAVYSRAYTGRIESIKTGLNHTIIKGISKIKKLTDLKRVLSFSKIMTVTDIIKKLAIDDAGLESTTNGISNTSISKQKGFSISHNLTIYQHLKKLGDLVGFDIYMDTFDKFNARLWIPESAPTTTSSSGQVQAVSWFSARDDAESDVEKQLIHTIYFGVNTIDMELDIKKRPVSQVEITTLADTESDEVLTINPPVGMSSSGGDGSSSSTSGSGTSDASSSSSSEGRTNKLVMSRVTKEDADKIADVVLQRSNACLKGKVTIIGAPQVRIGDGIKILGHIYNKKPFKNLNSGNSEYDASFSTESENEENPEESSSSSSSSSSSEETLFKITGLRHLYNDNIGFITKLNILESEIAQPESGEEEEEEEEEETEEGEDEESESEEQEEVDYLRLAGINFNFDSAVVLTRDLGDIKGIIEKVNHSEKKVMLAGHTDRMGTDAYNFTLSGLRAKSVLAIGSNDKAVWDEVIDSKKTKVEDYQMILKDFGFYKGEIDGIAPDTSEALKDFQKYYNNKYKKDIAVDGIIGKVTWGAIFETMTDVMNSVIDAGKFRDVKWIGCGESRPIDRPGTDQVKSEKNRRVEFLLYPDHKFPSISTPYASKAAMDAAYKEKDYKFNEISFKNVPLDMNLAKKADEDKKKVKVTLWGENGELLKDHKYNVEIGTTKRDGTTTSEGVAEEKIDDDKIEKITFRWEDGKSKTKTYYLEKADKDDFDTDEGQEHRFNNLYFTEPGMKEAMEQELEDIAEYDVKGMDEYKRTLEQYIKLLSEEE